MFKAGKLFHIIDIEQKTGNTSNGVGGFYQVWTKLYQDVPAQVKVTPAAETFTGQETQSQASFTVRTRYLPGITSANRIIFNGRTFNILGVDNTDELDVELMFQVKEVIAVEPIHNVKNISGKAFIA